MRGRLATLGLGFILAVLAMALCFVGYGIFAGVAEALEKTHIGGESFLIGGACFGLFWIVACLWIRSLSRPAAEGPPGVSMWIPVQPVKEPELVRRRYKFLQDGSTLLDKVLTHDNIAQRMREQGAESDAICLLGDMLCAARKLVREHLAEVQEADKKAEVPCGCQTRDCEKCESRALQRRYEFLRNGVCTVARWAPDSRWRVYLVGCDCEPIRETGQEAGFDTPEEAIDAALALEE